MIYFILFFILLFLVEVYGGSSLVVCKRRFPKIHLLVFLGLFFLIGLRNQSVGTDTITYIYEFLGETKEWNSIFVENPEPLYTVLLLLCQKIFNNYTAFLCVFALPISFAFAGYLKRYSEDYLISTLLFIVLGIMGFCMAGLRQSVALAISLIAYRYARERKILPFLICCLVAYGFHNSSIVLIFIYPLLAIKKINFKFWIAFIIAFVLGVTRNSVIMTVASFFFTQDRYGIYGTVYTSSLNYTMLIIQGTLLLFCYFFRCKVIAENKDNATLYIMAFIGIIFQACTPILGEFFRLSLYFSFSLCVLVPKTIAVQEKLQIRKLMYFGIIFLSFVYIFLSNGSIVRSYIPFWG